MVLRVGVSAPGFGLVELLVVVAILSILAIGTSLVAFPAGGALSRTTELLRADAVQTRRLAMLTGLEHSMLFSSDGWSVARRSGEGWRVLSSHSALPITLIAGESRWVFRPDGMVPDLILSLEADGVTRSCRTSSEHVLACR